MSEVRALAGEFFKRNPLSKERGFLFASSLEGENLMPEGHVGELVLSEAREARVYTEPQAKCRGVLIK